MNSINATITLTCHVDNLQNVFFQWFFRGNVISTNLENNGRNISVTLSNPWNALGSYQCMVHNIAGQGSTTIQLLPAPESMFLYQTLYYVCMCKAHVAKGNTNRIVIVYVH